MKRIADALELLTAQHDEIASLLTLLQQDADRVHLLGEVPGGGRALERARARFGEDRYYEALLAVYSGDG